MICGPAVQRKEKEGERAALAGLDRPGPSGLGRGGGEGRGPGAFAIFLKQKQQSPCWKKESKERKGQRIY